MARLSTIAVVICVAAAARSASAQDSAAQEAWEGKPVAEVKEAGFKRQRWSDIRDRLALRKGAIYDRAKRDRDMKSLFAIGGFSDVKIEPKIEDDGRVIFFVTVVEFQPLQDIRFVGLKAVSLATLKPLLRLNLGDMLNPYLQKLDREAIREQLLMKGYHFSSVREEIVDGDAGAILTWNITEGPLVTVKKIEFSGNDTVDELNLKRFMLNKEPGSFLIFSTGGEPFIMHNVEEDLKRVMLYYQLEGWLDITQGQRVFVQDLVFSADRSEVTIKIHIDEGQRYKIKSIRIEGVTGKVVPEEKIRAALVSKVDEFFSDNKANDDVKKIKDLYGKEAYILATVDRDTIEALDKYELHLKYKIVEGPEIRVGRIMVHGNTKTRYDVILRELKEFVPGEKYNQQLLNRGIAKLRDRQYFKPGELRVRNEAGQDPATRDVILDVEEGSTGQIRFAGGYSSSFGVLGIIEFTQKNFDIADLPKSLEDMFSGNAFAGGGQQLTIRYAPSQARQSFVINFREPWLFGAEYGMNVQGFSIRTLRESWVEEKLGATLGFDKRIDPFRFDVVFGAVRYDIRDIEATASSQVLQVAGVNHEITVTAGVTYDTRNSALIPSRGEHVSLHYEWAGDPLPGDFDFGKATFAFEMYRTIWEPETAQITGIPGHVVNYDIKIIRADAHGDSFVPLFDRIYAGGRDSIRGFDFRGMGPHEKGDPIGGNGYVFTSFEYSFPLLGEVLRGAAFYDVAVLSHEFNDIFHDKWRNTVGFGIRFLIPQLGNIPVALDFGFPLTKRSDDERQTVTFDIGKLF